MPSTFSTITAPGWSTIEIREDVDYDHAWKKVWSVLYKAFDVEFVSKDDGYIRTSWLYSWSGIYQQNYRVRVTVMFSEDHKKIDVKVEAQALQGNVWIIGVDNRLVSTVKSDIMGTIGRVTR
jgi:hypothetical protein